MWPENWNKCNTTSLGELLRKKLSEGNPCNEIFLQRLSITPETPFSHIKEMNMSINIQNLISLADPAWEKDLAELGILSDSIAADELRAEIEAQSKMRRSSDISRAATQILDLGRKVSEHKKLLIEGLRHIRAQEKAQLKAIQKLEESWNYGSKTLNYLPAAIAVGLTHPVHLGHLDPDLLKVKPLTE